MIGSENTDVVSGVERRMRIGPRAGQRLHDLLNEAATAATLPPSLSLIRGLFDMVSADLCILDDAGHWLVAHQSVCDLLEGVPEAAADILTNSPADSPADSPHEIALDGRFSDYLVPADRERFQRALCEADGIKQSIEVARLARSAAETDLPLALEIVSIRLHPNSDNPSRVSIVSIVGASAPLPTVSVNNSQGFDALTLLPDRSAFEARLQTLLQSRPGTQSFALLFVDLDRFKLVNDALGHYIGDRLLHGAAERMRAVLQEADTLARFGGDEFTILLPDAGSRQAAEAMARALLTQLNQPLEIDGHELFVGASIGIALFPEHGRTVAKLIKNADGAMYHFKRNGKNGYAFYEDDLQSGLLDRVNLEQDLRSALHRKIFRVFYQPIVCLRTGKVLAVEALARWPHEVLGLLLPEDFMSVAEETNLVATIDAFVAATAMRQLRQWRQQFPDLILALNVSSNRLESSSFAAQVMTALKAHALPPESLKLELSERDVIPEVSQIETKLRSLRNHGVRIAVDDFGTGYSSLAVLRSLPVDSLKIERSFVRDIGGDGQPATFVDAIIAMGTGLQLEIIAEGVETATQIRYLRESGCEQGQGYLFSEPLPADPMRALLENGFAHKVR